MFLDISIHDYNRDIIPFIKNGIILDTSVILIIINGLILTRISKKRPEELSDYKKLLDFLDLIKVNNKWDKFFITPPIFTEVCTHIRNDYNKHSNYKNIVNEVFPLLKNIEERLVCKNDIINHIDFKNPIIEVGDISIFLIAKDFINAAKKIAILARDWRINKQYEYSKNVMVMDYESIMLNRP
jgi:hypothetical protein